MKFLLALSTWLLAAAATSAQVEEHVLQLHGSGTTNPSKCFWSIMESLTEQASIPVRMSYRGVGSSIGIAEFAEQFNASSSAKLLNLFASGDIPISAETYAEINGNSSKKFVHLPVVAGAVSFFHSVPGTPDLNLTACILSQIYTQQITSWGDDQITEINPGMSEEVKVLSITAARRAEGSSSTDSATKVRSVNAVNAPDSSYSFAHILCSFSS